MRLESSPLMLKHSFRTEQELRWKEKAQMVRLLGFFDYLLHMYMYNLRHERTSEKTRKVLHGIGEEYDGKKGTGASETDA